MKQRRTPDGRYLVVCGPVWWQDGAKDYNRHLVKNTPCAAWYAGPVDDARTSG